MPADEPKIWTILLVLDWTREHFEQRGIDTPRLDAEVLIAHALGIPRVMLYARFDQPLSQDERAKIRAMVARRARGEPVAYITGVREFYSLEFEVSPDVLIPRPDTETLVERAIERGRALPSPVVADVGTGSGCIAVTIAKHLEHARIFAFDSSPAACGIAAANARRHGVEARVTVLESDLFAALPSETAPSLIVANLPYIPTEQIAKLARSVRDFEPKTALDGGPDGLAVIRRLVLECALKAPPGATLLFEIGDGQAESASEIFRASGFADLRVHADLAGTPRVIEAARS